MCILRIVAAEPVHGYAIARELEDLGFGSVTGGTLYPILNRLQRDEMLSARWVEGAGGPGRKIYELTARGAEELAHQAERWVEFAAMTSTALQPAIKETGSR